MSLATAARSSIVAAPRLTRAGRVLLPLLVLLVWTAALRLPFYQQTDKDEFFFSIIGTEWLRGGLPYVATFDIKPPGLFFIFAAVQSLFGASLATIKGMEVVAVSLGAYAIYALVRANGTERMALWVAILYPVYTLVVGGTVAVNMILQLPFLIAAFGATFAAVREDASLADRLRNAFLAGLAIGAAGMVKQTAIFEATAAFIFLVAYGERRRVPLLAGLFILGAALPAVAFGVYFLAAGHFAEMFNAAVVLALGRTGGDVLAAYGPELAYNFTPVGTVVNLVAGAVPLFFLWGGALFAGLRVRRVTAAVPRRLLIGSVLWLVASVASVAVGRGLVGYYVLATVPPLLILAGAFFCHGLDIAPGRRSAAFVTTLAAAVLVAGVIDRANLFTPSVFLAGDYDAAREVAADIRAHGAGPDDRLLVLNRGFAIYVETGLLPPSPYFHTVHLLGVFPTPSPDPLGASLTANPRFIVIADPSVRHVTELPARIDRALDYVAQHYRVAGTVTGAKDSYTLYEFRG